MRLIEIILVALLSPKGTLQCDIDICLTWDVRENELELKCKVSAMRFAISFENPWHQEQGHCLQPLPDSVCYNNYKNVTVIQNLAKETTVLKVHGRIDNGINGKWVCKHGTASGKAAVNVTVLTQVVYRNNRSERDKSCWEIYVCWSLLGYISTIAVFHLLYLLLKMCNCCKGIQSMEDKLFTVYKSCVSRSSCCQQMYCGPLCQRSLHFVLITFVVGIPLLEGFNDNEPCNDFHGFISLGVALGIIGAVLLELKCDFHSGRNRRKPSNTAVNNGARESSHLNSDCGDEISEEIV